MGLFGLNGAGLDPFGVPFLHLSPFEEREIVVALGIDAHDGDVPASFHLFRYLRDRLGADFIENSATEAEYASAAQQVHFRIRLVFGKDDFKQALENPDLHVIYDGHARYGRGACFDIYTGKANQAGEQWESGTSARNGIFRLGYPFVPVGVEDFGHHQYTFRPVPGSDPAPATADRHPDARRGLVRLEMPTAHRSRVHPDHVSADHRYWGYTARGSRNFLLHAHWDGSRSAPFDLGATDLQCKTFCHFGCSSRLHFRQIVRGPAFKGWVRPNPPTEKFAYFTTAASNAACTPIWVHALLTYNRPNAFQSWFASLEEAKRRANRAIRQRGFFYEVY